MGSRWTEESPEPPLDLRLVPMALAVWAGDLLGLAGHGRSAVVLRWAAVAVAIGLLAAVIRRRGRWPTALAAVAGLLAALTASLLHWQAAEHHPLTVAAGNRSWSVVQLTVTSAPRLLPSPFPATANGAAGAAAAQQWLIDASARQTTVAAMEIDADRDITVLAVGQDWGRVVPGQLIRVGGLVSPDQYSVLPGVLLTARTPPLLLADAPWWQRAAADVRQHLVGSAATLASDARGLLPGLVVGNTDGIPPDLAADAKATGLTHLLAVSGSHFALLCGLTVLVLRRAGPRVAAVGGAVVLVALVVLVGPGASVLRAAVMGSIALLAMTTGRTRSALPALAAATIGLLLWDPTLARSAGFALSVQATGGLILLAPVWSSALQRRRFPAGWADLLAVPAAAFVATMPVIAALSGSVSLASVPANLLAAPVVAPALIIGMACALAGPWWPSLAAALARADQPLLDWIAGVAHRLARWQSATVPWPASVPGVLMLTGLLLAAGLVLRHRRVRALLLAVVVGAAAVLVPARVIELGWPPPGWVLVACEVGQGDGMVLSTGRPGTAVVVDAGPDPDLIDGCLDRLGITTVPLVVLTHLHADHVDGLSGVLDGRSVGGIGVGPDRDAPVAWRTVQALAAAAGAPVVDLPGGARWGSGGLAVEVLGPQGAFRGTDSDENNDSVVLMATVSGVRILMTGDVQNEAQQQLLDEHADLRADVLEQPHHGSAKVLPAFVQAVSPRVSAIGVGRDNDYGQPSPKALAQLAALGTVVLRTDLQGDAAVCVVDGRLTTVIRGAVLPAGSSKGGGRSDGS